MATSIGRTFDLAHTLYLFVTAAAIGGKERTCAEGEGVMLKARRDNSWFYKGKRLRLRDSSMETGSNPQEGLHSIRGRSYHHISSQTCRER